MNTRIQVEHPVTEAITGIDIVAEQTKVAFGETLSFEQLEINEAGAAIECRINAEAAFDALPGQGTLTTLHLPGGPGVRIDTLMTNGATMPANYDSLMMKIISHGRTRSEALKRMTSALRETRIEGVANNIAMHLCILGDPDFVAGDSDVHLVETESPIWRDVSKT